MRFLELQKIASSSSSSSSNKYVSSHPAAGQGGAVGRGHCPTIADDHDVSLRSFPGPPSSPMGDVMQTPQFQLRRLKKQLATERENRDDLEVELAEHRKLLTEKGQLIAGHGEGGDASPGFCGFVMVLAILMDSSWVWSSWA